MILLVLAVGSVQAEKKLEVIDLAPEHVSAEDKARGQRYLEAQDAAAKIPKADAMDFIVRLNSAVEDGHALAKSGTMNGTQSRNQAIALNKLQDEGAKFGTVFTPFAKCNTASIEAATSWQGLIGSNEKLFVQSHQSYLQAAMECIKAAS
ncbi:hypothetical protein V2I59_00375 [Pseudomonas viridiflava]|uniref:hypothetical protein n=1 Tax=Pseudomonas viridiflava TaxID=33069 RepID=UPI000F017855|nr:hypothetical protein [Pseudomonas viridiflava]MEE4091980.1 hypothetical protein [Pseudomonas viridiflava]